MSDVPWLKFYPRDWRGDQSLRAVSMAARGMWIECLCIMHEARPYGHLILAGVPLDTTQLARIACCTPDEASDLLRSLIDAGVFERTDAGVVVCPRMVAEGMPRADRPPIPAAVKRAVRARDGNVCRYCGATEGPFEYDHVKPYSRGGKHTVANIVIACNPCNRDKGARTPKEWGR